MKSNRKIAIVVSSFCGYLKEELEKNQDIFITPLQIFIDDQQWFEGYYGEKEKYEFIEKFRNSNNFRTSLAPTSMIEEQMNKLSKDYDDVIYLPIHSSLSSSHDSILNLSKKYKNIHVFDNKLVGESFLIVAKEIKKRYEEESNSIEDIFKFLTWFNDRIIGYIVPMELKTFIKSGRLKGVKKAIMNSFNLSTIIEVDQTLNSVGVSRTKKISANKIMNKIDEFIKKFNMKPDDFTFCTIYVFDKTIKDIFENTLSERFKKTVDWTMEASIVTMLHTGYGACYIGINPKLELAPKFKNEKY